MKPEQLKIVSIYKIFALREQREIFRLLFELSFEYLCYEKILFKNIDLNLEWLKNAHYFVRTHMLTSGQIFDFYIFKVLKPNKPQLHALKP